MPQVTSNTISDNCGCCPTYCCGDGPKIFGWHDHPERLNVCPCVTMTVSGLPDPPGDSLPINGTFIIAVQPDQYGSYTRDETRVSAVCCDIPINGGQGTKHPVYKSRVHRHYCGYTYTRGCQLTSVSNRGVCGPFVYWDYQHYLTGPNGEDTVTCYGLPMGTSDVTNGVRTFRGMWRRSSTASAAPPCPSGVTCLGQNGYDRFCWFPDAVVTVAWTGCAGYVPPAFEINSPGTYGPCDGTEVGGPNYTPPATPMQMATLIASDPPLPATPKGGKRAVVSLATGEVGKRLWDISGDNIRRYAKRVGADFHLLSQAPADRFATAGKFAIRPIAEAYDRTLYVDADVLFDPSCPDLFDTLPAGGIHAHPDHQHGERVYGSGWYSDWLAKESAAICDSQGWEKPDRYTCWNNGVVMMDLQHSAAWEWVAKPMPDFYIGEQHLFNLNVMRHGFRVSPLPKRINYQWWIDQSMTGPAHVWHWSGTNHLADPGKYGLMADKLKTFRTRKVRNEGCGCGSAADVRKALR